MSLLRVLGNFGICPHVVKNASHILLIEIGPLGLRFLASNNYIPGDVYAIAEQFDVAYTKHYFPLSFFSNKQAFIDNFHYRGKIVNFKNFYNEMEDSKDFAQKQLFYHSYQNLDWDFQKELIMYTHLKLYILIKSFTNFIMEFFYLQSPSQMLLNPLNPPLTTLSSAIYKLYKVTNGKNYNLHTVFNEYGLKRWNVSRIEHQYVSFLEHTNKSDTFVTAFNNPKGQKYFKEAVPDAYCATKKSAFFICGCFFHNHYYNCTINKKATKDSITIHGQTFEQANQEFEQKLMKLLSNNPGEVSSCIVVYECQMKQNSDFQSFLKNDYIWAPITRLIPRDAFKGAYFDTYALKWSKLENPNENLYYFDINGLYSFVALQNKFMVGKYLVLIGNTINNLKVIENKFYLDGKRVLGAILLTILAPDNLLYPFLSCKSKSNTLFNSLCKQCSEMKSGMRCHHTEKQRAITGVFMISEVEYALSLNYQILHIHECHAYTESDYILKDFVEKLVLLKTASTDCFKGLHTNEEKIEYCKMLNAKIGLKGTHQLTPETIKPNVTKRNFYKLAQNSLFGKFGQRSDKSKLLFVTSQEQIEQLIADNLDILDVFLINENLCALSYKPKPSSIQPSLKTNVYISAQITAFARQVIHEHIMTLSKIDHVRLFQVDCDSLIFSVSKNVNVPLQLSHAIGDFKNEVDGEILDFYSLGNKNYIICFKNNTNGKIETINKVSGLSLNSKELTPELYRTFLEKLQNDIFLALKVPNRKRKLNWNQLKSVKILQSFTLSNNLKLRRHLLKHSEHLQTVPFGYVVDLE